MCRTSDAIEILSAVGLEIHNFLLCQYLRTPLIACTVENYQLYVSELPV